MMTREELKPYIDKYVAVRACYLPSNNICIHKGKLRLIGNGFWYVIAGRALEANEILAIETIDS